MKFLLFAVLAYAYTNKDFPGYIDPKPVKKSCNRIEYYTECKDAAHYRGKDYIPFRFHDEATDCSYDLKYDSCTYVSQMIRIKIRNGCLISWCKRK